MIECRKSIRQMIWSRAGRATLVYVAVRPIRPIKRDVHHTFFVAAFSQHVAEFGNPARLATFGSHVLPTGQIYLLDSQELILGVGCFCGNGVGELALMLAACNSAQSSIELSQTGDCSAYTTSHQTRTLCSTHVQLFNHLVEECSLTCLIFSITAGPSST
jgi:hypothetical protein